MSERMQSGLLGRANAKLREEQGASFLFAMLAILVAAFVVCVIIAAAVSSITSVSSDRTTRQTHLTLTNAAELVASEMESTKVIIHADEETPSTVKGNYAAEMQEALEYVSEHSQEFVCNETMHTAQITTLSVDGLNSSDISVDDVTVYFTMDVDYNVEFTLVIKGGSENVTLSMTGSKKENAAGDTTYTWKSPLIKGGE